MDSTLKTLLDLDGSILDQGNGYWIKIDAWQVPVSKSIPHGIRYAHRCMNPMVSAFWGMTMPMQLNCQISINMLGKNGLMTTDIGIARIRALHTSSRMPINY